MRALFVWTRRVRSVLLRLVGIGLFAFILLRIDVNAMLVTLMSVQLPSLLLAIALTAPFFLIKSWRWMKILESINISISWKQSTMLYGAGLFAGQVTPGQLGELIRAHYLSRRGYDMLPSVNSVLLDRLLDLGALLIVGLPGFFIFDVTWDIGRVSWFLLAFFVGVTTIFVCILIYAFDAYPHFRQWALDRIQWLRKLGLIWSAVKSPHLAIFISSTLLALGVNFLRFYCLLAALGLNVPLLYFLVGMAFVSLVGLVPITVAGLGTRDVALVFLFGQVGILPEQAIAFSILILFVNYLLNFLWGFPAWWIEAK